MSFLLKKNFVSDVKKFKNFINMPVNYINKNLKLIRNELFNSL